MNNQSLEVGTIIKIWSLGIWMHKASLYYFQVATQRNNDEKDADIFDRIYLLYAVGFQKLNEGWLPKEGYPKTMEILYKHETDEYIPLGMYDSKFEIINQLRKEGKEMK